MKTYLIEITIGPVQEYIAAARKLRDLWFGSYLLSELSKTVARSLYDNKADLIFPFVRNWEPLIKYSPLIVANKVLATINDLNDPQDVIGCAKRDWEAHRQAIGYETLETLKREEKYKDLEVDKELFLAQMMDTGEFFAGWVTCEDVNRSCRQELERLVAGRKNLREFEKPGWDGAGFFKSSLDGIREGVVYSKKGEIKGFLKKNERLDAMGAIKRVYPITILTIGHARKHFDDLSDMALMPFKKGYGGGIHNALLLKYMRHFEPSLKDIPSDLKTWSKYSELFYPDEKKLRSDPKLKETYKALVEILGAPQPYAAIMVGDGDYMGKTLENIDLIDKNTPIEGLSRKTEYGSIAGLKYFTEQLSLFAKDVSGIIENQDGALIYSGGDDVMAYLPLHTLVTCAYEVKEAFLSVMDRIFKKLNLTGEKPTFSVGIAIVHYTHPLDDALNLARKAESMAKAVDGKNALAIIQSKRSGQNIALCGKWDETEKEAGMKDRLEKISELYRTGFLPKTLAYQLRCVINQTEDRLAYDGISAEADEEKSTEKRTRLVPKCASSAYVLNIFEQKEHSEILNQLLLKERSITTLSNALIIGKQLAAVKLMSEGKADKSCDMN